MPIRLNKETLNKSIVNKVDKILKGIDNEVKDLSITIKVDNACACTPTIRYSITEYIDREIESQEDTTQEE